MTHYDVFNGDADGICALHQLRLAEPKDSVLVTGVKRDIALLRQIVSTDADSITVLDISMDKNRVPLEAILQAGTAVTYFDHHHAGKIPDSVLLTANINTAGDVCTGLLVNQHLKGRFLPWAVTALFGDNLYDAATNAAQPLDLNDEQLGMLKELGTLMNYNGYGSAVSDLHFAPDDLYRKVQPYEDPFDFIASDSAFKTLREGYAEDMSRAASIAPHVETEQCAIFLFPDDPFSRRVSGVYSNQLARTHKDRAHALVSLLPSGDYLVSVRAPLATKSGADELCLQFPTGGGRKAAAGINQLPAEQLERFAETMRKQFDRR